MNDFLKWLFLGLVQGLTDIFPISSTGHLAFLREFLSAKDFDLSLAAGLHSGSLAAITIFFRKEIAALWRNFRESWGLVRSWRSRPSIHSVIPAEYATPYLLGLSLLPVAIEGLSLRFFAQEVFSHKYLPLLLLMVNGAIIFVTALAARGERTIKELNWKEYALIGVIQGLAVLPGISRLGLVLCTGLWRRLKWQEAISLTFILSIPVVMGALAVEINSILSAIEVNPQAIAYLILGVMLAFAGSWLSLKVFTSHLLERRKLSLFGFYCLMLGSFASIFLYFWK